MVGVHLRGQLREGVTATDLVLTSRIGCARKSLGKFVEFYGEGSASLRFPDRRRLEHVARYGATMGYFPVDQESVDYCVLRDH